ncbi:MAG: UPF0175 family protein [Candidatus Hydrothermarchaeaceae archaeon]
MKTVAMRIPKDLEEELEEISRVEGLDKSTALRKLLKMGLRERKKELALSLLQRDKVTLWKASKIAGITIWEMIDLVKDKGIALPIKAEEVIDDIKAGMK